jgi:hypothetical protein
METTDMQKLLVLSVAAALACGASFKDQSRDAMPSNGSVQMGSPQPAQPAGSSALVQASTVGDFSTWWGTTVGVAGVFNAGTGWVLGLLVAITDNEPTSCTSDSCTWGPGSSALDANTFKLVVTRDGNNFKYELSAEPKSKPGSGFIVFLSGSTAPGPQRHHGSGTFTIDFDKAALLDRPSDDTGKLTVVYTNVGPVHISATFNGAKNTDPKHLGQKNNLKYDYANDTSGGGDLDLAVHNTVTDERFSIHSRWKNDGKGRADVEAKGTSSTGAYDAHLSECWGAAPFSVVFFQSDLSLVFGPNSGIERSCAYLTAAYSTTQAD